MTNNTDGASCASTTDGNQASGSATNTSSPTPSVLLEALKIGRQSVADEIAATLESSCLLDSATLEPDETTLDADVAPIVAQLRVDLQTLDAALAQAQAPQQDEGSGAASTGYIQQVGPSWKDAFVDGYRMAACSPFNEAYDHDAAWERSKTLAAIRAETALTTPPLRGEDREPTTLQIQWACSAKKDANDRGCNDYDAMADALRAAFKHGPDLALPDRGEDRKDLRAALKCAKGHIEHMAAWIGSQNAGYSFESLGEDMPGINTALNGKEARK